MKCLENGFETLRPGSPTGRSWAKFEADDGTIREVSMSGRKTLERLEVKAHQAIPQEGKPVSKVAIRAKQAKSAAKSAKPEKTAKSSKKKKKRW